MSENRDQGIGLNGTVKTEIVAVSIAPLLILRVQYAERGGKYCLRFGLYKIFVHSKAILQYSIVLVVHPPSASIAILSDDY